MRKDTSMCILNECVIATIKTRWVDKKRHCLGFGPTNQPTLDGHAWHGNEGGI